MGLKTQVLSVARFPKEDSICKFFFLSSREKEARKLHTPPRKKASPGGRKACQETRRLPHWPRGEIISPVTFRFGKEPCRNPGRPEDTGFNRAK